ncbi:MAG: hypothetical protein AVDCRST_MAG11-3236, partial [uncultured Gemmatimonadaceae bacterium]
MLRISLPGLALAALVLVTSALTFIVVGEDYSTAPPTQTVEVTGPEPDVLTAPPGLIADAGLPGARGRSARRAVTRTG